MNVSEFKKQNYTVLGTNNIIDGDLKFYGDTIIHCNVTGTISMIDDAKLILERAAVFEGILYCKEVEIFGDVKGTIKASGTVIVRSSAKLSGNIQANKLSVYPGAVLNIEGHTNDDMAIQAEPEPAPL